MSLLDVPHSPNGDDTINVIIEIPKGSSNKYEFDKTLGAFILDRAQPTAMKQPYDYGFVPKTLGDDGDPLDAMIVIDEPLFPGLVVPGRVIGLMKMVDDGENDEKLICVADSDINYSHVQTLDDLGEHFKDKVTHYFEHYKDLQNKQVKVTGWGDTEEAKALISRYVKNYR